MENNTSVTINSVHPMTITINFLHSMTITMSFLHTMTMTMNSLHSMTSNDHDMEFSSFNDHHNKFSTSNDHDNDNEFSSFNDHDNEPHIQHYVCLTTHFHHEATHAEDHSKKVHVIWCRIIRRSSGRWGFVPAVDMLSVSSIRIKYLMLQETPQLQFEVRSL